MFTKKSTLLVFFVLYMVCVRAQSIEKNLFTKEAGMSLGAAYYMGDLNPKMPFIGARESAGLFFRINHNYRWSYRFNANYGRVTANDAKSFTQAHRDRNLSFKSMLLELSGQVEFNFLPYRSGDATYNFSPYLFVGLGAFYYNPKAELDGTSYALRSLSTEGQGLSNYRKTYGIIAACMPFGIGVKYTPRPKLSLGAEWSLRKTSTDYIDDVSSVYKNPALIAAAKGSVAAQLSDRSVAAKDLTNIGHLRGNPDNRDWYGFLQVSVALLLPSKKDKCPSYK